ncbi:hypothetical protein WJX84_006317 [Apatococcus fuscideae]|uniref:CHAD domain-containing protein n=1 Tax=Apatococcus fuscideae TaxID=2026836 RepID=A0AAW1TH14_9CHLO
MAQALRNRYVRMTHLLEDAKVELQADLIRLWPELPQESSQGNIAPLKQTLRNMADEKLSASRHHASKLVDLFKLAKRVEFAEKLAPFVQAANAMDCTLAAHDNDLSQVRTLAVGMTDDLLDLRQKRDQIRKQSHKRLHSASTNKKKAQIDRKIQGTLRDLDALLKQYHELLPHGSTQRLQVERDQSTQTPPHFPWVDEMRPGQQHCLQGISVYDAFHLNQPPESWHPDIRCRLQMDTA